MQKDEDEVKYFFLYKPLRLWERDRGMEEMGGEAAGGREKLGLLDTQGLATAVKFCLPITIPHPTMRLLFPGSQEKLSYHLYPLLVIVTKYLTETS